MLFGRQEDINEICIDTRNIICRTIKWESAIFQGKNYSHNRVSNKGDTEKKMVIKNGHLNHVWALIS